MNGTMWSKHRSILPNTLQRLPRHYIFRDILWFFLKDEEFVSMTINEGSVDLDRFPASKIHQLAKKMESSKTTARHIKQVAGDPQVAQINLMQHQCRGLSNGKYKKKPPPSRNKYSIRMWSKEHQTSTRRALTLDWLIKNKDRCSKCEDSTYLEVFQCP